MTTTASCSRTRITASCLGPVSPPKLPPRLLAQHSNRFSPAAKPVQDWTQKTPLKCPFATDRHHKRNHPLQQSATKAYSSTKFASTPSDIQSSQEHGAPGTGGTHIAPPDSVIATPDHEASFRHDRSTLTKVVQQLDGPGRVCSHRKSFQLNRLAGRRSLVQR